MIYRTPKEAKAYIDSLNHNWRPVVIEPYRPKRSLDQNAKFHAMLGALAKHLGYTPHELKLELKMELGWYRDVTVKGERFRVFDSTADKSKPDMISAIDLLYRMGSEVGFVFPEQEYA